MQEPIVTKMLQNLDFEPTKPYNLREYANVRIPFIKFARHGRALTDESSEHAQIVGSV